MADEYLLAPEIRSSTYEQGANTTFCLLFSKIKMIRIKLFLLLGVQLSTVFSNLRHREYSVWASTWRHVRVFHMIFCAWDYRSGPIFRRQSQCNVKTLSDSVFDTVVHKQRNAVQHLSVHTEFSYGTQFLYF